MDFNLNQSCSDMSESVNEAAAVRGGPLLCSLLSHLTQISGGLMSPQCEPEVKVLLGGLTLRCCCSSSGLNAAESESFPSPSTGGSPGGKHGSGPAASPAVGFETHWAECGETVMKCSLQVRSEEERAGWRVWGGGFWQRPCCWRAGESALRSWIWSAHMKIPQCWTMEWKVFFCIDVFSLCEFVLFPCLPLGFYLQLSTEGDQYFLPCDRFSEVNYLYRRSSDSTVNVGQIP